MFSVPSRVLKGYRRNSEPGKPRASQTTMPSSTADQNKSASSTRFAPLRAFDVSDGPPPERARPEARAEAVLGTAIEWCGSGIQARRYCSSAARPSSFVRLAVVPATSAIKRANRSMCGRSGRRQRRPDALLDDAIALAPARATRPGRSGLADTSTRSRRLAASSNGPPFALHLLQRDVPSRRCRCRRCGRRPCRRPWRAIRPPARSSRSSAASSTRLFARCC